MNFNTTGHIREVVDTSQNKQNGTSRPVTVNGPSSSGAHIQKEPFYGQIVEVPGYKSPKIFNVTITLPHGREVPVQRAIATRKDELIFIKVHKNDFTRMAIEFESEQRQIIFRLPHDIGNLQDMLKVMKVQTDDRIIECTPSFNYFNYFVKVSGPQNYHEIKASNITRSDIHGNLDDANDCCYLYDLKKVVNLSNCEPICLDVGGKTFYVDSFVIKKYGYGILNKMKSYRQNVTNATYFTNCLRYTIDRDGDIFEFILDFLKTGQLNLPTGFRDYKILATEAQYYEIEPLVQKVMPLINPMPWKFFLH